VHKSVVYIIQYRGEFALVDISWMAIVVGVLTNALALPPNLLIALLFRRSVVRLLCSVYCVHYFYICLG